MTQSIPFFRHDLGQQELDSIAAVFHGNILTTGDFVDEFEKRFAEFLRSRYAIGVTSCTAALQLALHALDIGPGDEVITTPLSFIATATAIIQAGATPIFVDVEPDTGNINANAIESAITSRTRAILPVHLYGQMCDMRAIKNISDRFNLRIIEDAAHCIEGIRDGVRPGELSDAACFSFYATKNLTCGEGGALVTNDKDMADRLRLLRMHGMTKTAADREREGYQHWDMVIMGWKYNMDNIQAAMLVPQFNRIMDNLERRHTIANNYESLLRDADGIRMFSSRKNVTHARHLFPVMISRANRDSVIQALKLQGIGTTVNYRPIHLTSYFKKCYGFNQGSFPEAERIGTQVISLPFYPQIPMTHIRSVADALIQLSKFPSNESVYGDY